MTDLANVAQVFDRHRPNAVVHLAAVVSAQAESEDRRTKSSSRAIAEASFSMNASRYAIASLISRRS